LALSVGVKVNVTHPTAGWTLKPFWVTALQLMPNTTVAVSLQEYDPTAYDLSTMEDRRTFPATSLDSIFVVPMPGAVTGTGLATAGLRVTWVAASYGLIDYYEIQAKCTSCGDEYGTIGRVREGLTQQAYAPLARPGQTWDARVRVVNVIGWPSEWVNCAPVVIPVAVGISPGAGSLILTGYAPTITVSTTAPTLTSVPRAQSGGNKCIPGDGQWTHGITRNTTGADDVNYQIDIDVANDAAGTSYVGLVTGLSTVSGLAYNHATGLTGVTPGATTYYRKYKVKVVRKSDSTVMSSMNTTQGTITMNVGESCL
jgi:hypothetical protein